MNQPRRARSCAELVALLVMSWATFGATTLIAGAMTFAGEESWAAITKADPQQRIREILDTMERDLGRPQADDMGFFFPEVDQDEET